ncbi:nucleotide diphosphate sugar epimerase family protein [Reticulomyxa filosa]|uniref:Nucleotide diphosphate sugar epimerase family protein n=1 Tax=Reticulomyxa filosa TaxID=46433 RepID=X6NFT7_RETFI|nr:nucleotide diphosphate sugar epimerase family protein [Reticulomyxa filosa]|eukprot:ETO24619.1 nucleotide diphosphate sugar epimerase family protein [Reticulomyxa filosa]
MKFLWTASLKINTVHVRDVAAAIWVACTESKPGRCYNLSDKGNTSYMFFFSFAANDMKNSQGSLNALIEKIFGIKTGFQNTVMNAAASKMMSSAAKSCNDKHLPMWSAVMKVNDNFIFFVPIFCRRGEYNLGTTPLSPYLDEEILTKNHTSVNGQYIEKDTSFKYSIPEVIFPFFLMTVEQLQEIVEEFIEMNYFPNIRKIKQITVNICRGIFLFNISTRNNEFELFQIQL